ncbi:MAG: hypothetical protein WCA39_16510 [Nitrososphaeraceae archaeon]
MQSPEERYQDKKRHWYFHKSSWYMRGIKSGYDGNGCNNGVCVPACRYYTQSGRIENEEVLKSYEDNGFVENMLFIVPSELSRSTIDYVY